MRTSNACHLPRGIGLSCFILLALVCSLSASLQSVVGSSSPLLSVGHTVRNSQILEELRSNLDFPVLIGGGASSNPSRSPQKRSKSESNDVLSVMYDLTGEPFECAYVDEDGSIHGQPKTIRNAVPVSKVTLESVTTVLDMVKDECQVIKKGYWSYEWCHNKHVRQFHVDGGVVTADWSLGLFANASLSSSPVDGAARRAGSAVGADAINKVPTYSEKHKSSFSASVLNFENGEAKQHEQQQRKKAQQQEGQTRPTYLGQFFEDGQHCDETNAPRRTEARLFCCPASGKSKGKSAASSSSWGVSLLEVEEVATCEYLVTLCSPMLCDAGLYMPEALDAWEALRPLSGMCLFFHMEWWSYEFCFEQKMRQFHMANNKGKEGRKVQSVTDDFLLGKFDALATADELRDDVIADFAVDPSAKTPLFRDEGPEPAIVQVYAGGSPCELSGQQRQTYVRYVCRANEKASRVLSIEEAATCRYNVVVNTPFLCKHSLFRKEAKDAETVRCRSRKDIQDDKQHTPDADSDVVGGSVSPNL